jgi:uncharacterized protein YsxB (DUF464 family)
LIRVAVELFPDGCLASFRAQGHSENGRYGKNVACAAVTQMMRTAARLLYTADGLEKDGEAVEPGDMRLVVSNYEKIDRHWLRGVTDFLLLGLGDLAAEFPNEIALTVK